MGVLTLLAVLGVALCVARAARVPHSQAIFCTVAFVILTLYFAALAGFLWWAALAIHVGGVTLLGIEALRLVRRRAELTLPVPIGVFLLLCSWFLLLHGGDQYTRYDEFAHWGIFIKEILALDGFWTGDTNAMHPRYPPAAPLWQYLFNSFQPYSESTTYLANFALLLAPLLLLWNNLRWPQAGWIVAILGLVLLAIANFGLGVNTLYVDHIIGAWYFGTVWAAFADPNLGSGRVALYAAPLAALALLKDAGFAFAASGALIITALFFNRAIATARIGLVLKTSAALAALLVPTLLCVQLWSWNRDAAGAAGDVQSFNGVLSGLAQAGGASDIDDEIDRRAWEVFFDQQLSNSAESSAWGVNEFTYGIRAAFTDSYRLTTFSWLVLFAGWCGLIAFAASAEEWRRRWLVVAVGVLLTALVYIVALHWSYRFAFGARGLDLPSYVRYVHVIALPMLLLSFCPLLPAFRDSNADRAVQLWGWRINLHAPIFCGALLAMYVAETPYLPQIVKPAAPYQGRTALEPIVADIRAKVGQSRLWIHFTQDGEHRPLTRVALYLLSPARAIFEHSDEFLYVTDTARIADIWRLFDYVWIASPLTPESVAGLSRFDTGGVQEGLFKVHVLESGDVALEPISAR